MKRSLGILVLALAAGVALQAATVNLTASGPLSGSFDVFVNVTNVFDPPHDGDSFLAYGFDLSFDNTVLSYLGETPGPLFDDLSSNPGIDAQVAGTASSILLNDGDFTEPLNLAVLHFSRIGIGGTGISITGDAAGSLDQGLIYLSGSDSFAARTELQALPEPATFGLIGAALLAFGIVRRR
ncbi:MAG TPA: PEP-CTERM sorting domain-containing protein [Bryobacteraceae bacterium]|jgi:hypothetical protein